MSPTTANPLIPQNIDAALVIQIVFRFIQKAARRIVKLSGQEWGQLEKLALMLKEASETERAEIFEAMAEVLFPEETFAGGATEAAVPEDARAKLDAYRRQVGAQIEARRKALKMTQDKLAELAGIPQSHVSRLECGKHAATRLTILRIAGALQTKPALLDPSFNDEEGETQAHRNGTTPRGKRKGKEERPVDSPTDG